MADIERDWYYQPLTLDCADGFIMDPLPASPDDANGRGIELSLIGDDFQPLDSGGCKLYLEWQTKKGLGINEFEAVDAARGRWRIAYPASMLQPGLAFCRIAVYMGEKQVVTSRRFSVKVEADVITMDRALKDTDFSLFAQAVIDLNDLDDEMRSQAMRYAAAEDAREARYVKAEAARDAEYEAAENARASAYGLAEQTRNTAYSQAEGAREAAYRDAEEARDTAYARAEAARQNAYGNAEDSRQSDFDAKIAAWPDAANTIYNETADRLVREVAAAYEDQIAMLRAMVEGNAATIADLHGAYRLAWHALIAPSSKASFGGTTLALTDGAAYDGSVLALQG